jgi:LPS O-antigen subunit length determinant protein (WzzB/FepE family)
LEKSNYRIDEIELKDFINILWQKIITVLTITTIFTLLSLIHAFVTPDLYKSEALLAPTTQSDSLSNKLGSLSSLSGLTGISIPVEAGNKTTEAIARMKSYKFFVNLVMPNIKLENLLAVDGWNAGNNILKYDDTIFDISKKTWAKNSKAPSSQEAYIAYQDIFKISQDSKTSFVSISIEHHSPHIAKTWLEIVINNVNESMRETDRADAQKAIDFLNESASLTKLSEIKSAISILIEDQMKALMLAEANKNYIFKEIESPIASEQPFYPNKLLIVFLGILLGFTFGIFAAFYKFYFESVRT